MSVLVVFYLMGSWIQQIFHLFIPGSVIGMLLLFTALSLKIIDVRWIEEGIQFVIRNMMLLFIPATVGIISYFDLFKGQGMLMIVIVLLSTVIVMGISAISSKVFSRSQVEE